LRTEKIEKIGAKKRKRGEASNSEQWMAVKGAKEEEKGEEKFGGRKSKQSLGYGLA